jgi:uncharacterized hydrophobic protein (TIGR00271 family)
MALTFLTRFQVVKDKDKDEAVEKLIRDSTPDFEFFLFVILSVLMATFGLLINSVAAVIGSMLVAPILYPILSLALGMSISDHQLIGRSLFTIGKSVGFAVFAGLIATLLMAPTLDSGVSAIIAQRAEPSIVYFLIAVIAGLAVSFSLVRPELSSTLPGVAVSVALIPPLAVVGIGIAKLEWGLVSGALILFLLNVIGVVFASMVSFSLTNLYNNRETAEKTIEKEQERVEEEKKEAEKIEEEVKNGNGSS